MIVIIKRTKQFYGFLVPMKVVLDNVEVTRVGNGQSTHLEVLPGTHHLSVSMSRGYFNSNVVTFSGDDETFIFEAGSTMKGLKLFFTRFHQAFKKNTILYLKQVK